MTAKIPSQQLLHELDASGIENLICLSKAGSYYRMITHEDKRYQQYSITKTLCTLACLHAVELGFLSLEDTVGELLERGLAQLAHTSSCYQNIGLDTTAILAGNYQLQALHYQLKLKDLLCLRIGHAKSSLFAHERNEKSEENWIELCLNKEFSSAPSSSFKYNNAGHYLAGVLCVLNTGKKLSELIAQLLAAILQDEELTWDRDRLGFEFGPSGFHASSSALARFALILLHEGHCPAQLGREDRLISENSLSLMRTVYSTAAETGINTAYGMGFWIHEDSSYSAQGTFGQIMHINPHQGAAFVCNGNTEDMQLILKRLREEL